MSNWPYELLLGLRYTRASRSTGRNGFIAFIGGVSMLGIALGVAALIIVLSVWNGFQKEVLERMLSVVSHVEIYAPGGGPMPDMAQRLAIIRQQPGVQAATPFVASQALLARGDDVKGVVVRGVDPALEPSVTDVAKNIAPAVMAQMASGSFGTVLGVELASALGVHAGDKVTLLVPGDNAATSTPRYQSLQVLGVLDSGHYEYDASLMLLNIADAKGLFALAGNTGIRVRLDDFRTARAMGREIANALDNRVVVRDWTQQDRTWFAALQHQKRMMFIILALIVAVAAFNLVSTLVMTVTDKRADIAILRTLGASPRSIMTVFMVQGAMVGVLGTLGGLVLGWGVAHNLDWIVPALEALFRMKFIPADIYRINHMPSDPQSGDIVPIVLIALALSFAATLYPSWRASRVNPAEALRYE